MQRQRADLVGSIVATCLTRLQPNVFRVGAGPAIVDLIGVEVRCLQPGTHGAVIHHDTLRELLDQVGVMGVFNTGSHIDRVVGPPELNGGAMPLMHTWQGLR